MNRLAPSLLVVNFWDIDIAHYGAYSLYLEAIRRTDRLVHELWQHAQSLPQYRDRTTLLVVPELGRDGDIAGNGFANHRSGDESCRRVWLVALGAGVPQGRRHRAADQDDRRRADRGAHPRRSRCRSAKASRSPSWRSEIGRCSSSAKLDRRGGGAGASRTRRDARASAGDVPRVHPDRAGEVGDAVRAGAAPTSARCSSTSPACRRRTLLQLFAGGDRGVEAEAGCDRICARATRRVPGRGAGAAAQAAAAAALAAGGRRVLPGDPAGARAPAPSRRCAAPAGRADLRQRHRRPDRASCGAASRAAASACRWRWTACAAPEPSCARCSAATRARRAPLLAGVARPAPGVDAARCLDRRIGRRRCTRCSDGAGCRGAAARDLDRPELRPAARLPRRADPRALREDPDRRREPAGVRRLRPQPAHRAAPGALRHAADVVQAFVRDVFLTGNGTLFVNNTFVEWAAVQALRRAQPRLLVARYGVRDKMKPFSSLLLFSQPRALRSDPRSSRIRSARSSTSSSCRTTSG